MPIIKKKVNGADASHRGAFAFGDCISFSVEAPRKLGASAVVLRICRDGEEDRDYPFSFYQTKLGTDEYRLSLHTKALCNGRKEGLFFYEILFLRGNDTLFTSTWNQVDFSLERQSENRFILLVHRADFHTPSWFGGTVMYHVFVDRFYRGDGKVETRSDVIINKDWENGVPQYPEKNGDKLANNMFFGGNLWGIAEKLPYLRDLGVGVLYLSPIFKAYSNHKYDTGDYLEIDGMFGGKEAFEHLLNEAKRFGIKVILDGVFNHTGDNSRYFDRYGEYGGCGAYSDPNSEWRSWFRFKKYPNEYETWWGIQILPKLNHDVKECRSFFTGKDGVGEAYVKMGIGGWRLDVADELSDEFLNEFRRTIKNASNGDAIIIGEVWENAAVKIAYGKRRQYFLGNQLDSVMNYPLRNGILAFLLEGNAEFLGDVLKEIYASYPHEVCNSLMNLLGTHDTERILTVLGEGNERNSDESNDVLAYKRLDARQYQRGITLLKLAAAIQFTVYGVPSVFYGD
ncbi:MAG: glycoside hydrolase family 13 protein, partial [Clostridia bacterium]|nr:glycoside hydrolase family 13 protein [Clostridia bacterium]